MVYAISMTNVLQGILSFWWDEGQNQTLKSCQIHQFCNLTLLHIHVWNVS